MRAAKEAMEAQKRRHDVSSELNKSLVADVVAEMVAEMLSEEYILTLHAISCTGVPIADEMTSSDPYAVFTLLDYHGVANELPEPALRRHNTPPRPGRHCRPPLSNQTPPSTKRAAGGAAGGRRVRRVGER